MQLSISIHMTGIHVEKKCIKAHYWCWYWYHFKGTGIVTFEVIAKPSADGIIA